MLPQKIVFVDTETTGLSVTKDRIIEIGILRIENNKIVAKYQTLINPQTFFSPFITSLTGITQEEVANAPTFREVKHTITALLSGAVFVAHNVRFDYGFLKNEFRREEMSFSSKHFCTAKLSRTLFPKFAHHNLDSLIERFGLSVKHRHRAYDDAHLLWQFYKKLQKDITPDVLEHAIGMGLKRPSLPLRISSDMLDSLPESAGVYVFYGEKKIPLYVGKSVNIRERVLSHFSSDTTESREMKIAQQIDSIETFPTAGELGALLKEAQVVKELQPIYNRKLRSSRRLTVLRLDSENHYPTVRIEELVDILPSDIPTIKGVFKSKKAAKEFLYVVSKEHKLCQKLLGLEKTKAGCFSYRLGTCLGACVQKENPLAYRARFIMAFSSQQLQRWPFSGPILISENSSMENATDFFVIDKWCLLGKQKERDGLLNFFDTNDYRFDLDTYKILQQYIKKYWKHITPISPSNTSSVAY
ncbi:MAG TPA: exonuclease domain-containing protein [Candidatus Saccharimonadales bacterium]|nr:exonuclease domain-containing protein [Candidatus Saccharimonadales bacterium]